MLTQLFPEKEADPLAGVPVGVLAGAVPRLPGGEAEEGAEAGAEGGAVPSQYLRALPGHALKTRRLPVTTAVGFWNLKMRGPKPAQMPPLLGGDLAGAEVGEGVGAEAGVEAGVDMLQHWSSLPELYWLSQKPVPVGLTEIHVG